jgi:type 1 glutamine amidotransferase
MNRMRSVLFHSVMVLSMMIDGFGAPVAPDPSSLLKGKRVMMLTGAASDHHLVPRRNAVAGMKRIQAAAGMAGLTLVDVPDNLTFADLDTIDIIVCSYVSKIDTLVGKPFENAFRKWLASGKRGWVGLHNTGANSAGEWNWFRDSVASMRYREHVDAAQKGTVKITTDPVVRSLPVLKGLDAQFTVADEWYSFDLPPKAPAAPTWPRCKVLYSLDESTVRLKDPMGAHPVAWIREDSFANRYFYTLLVHSDEGSASDFFQSLLLRGLEHAAGYGEPVAAMKVPSRLELSKRPVFPPAGWSWTEIFRGRISAERP